MLVHNLFYRSQPAPVVNGAFDFSKPEDRARLMAMRATIADEGAIRDAVTLFRFLDAQPQTDPRRRASIQGYCMGGPLAFRTAAAIFSRIGAVGSFHGGGLVTKEASSPHLLIPRTEASYVVAIARNDDAQDLAAKTVLKDTFARAKLATTVDVYAANHGWCVFGSQAYDEGEAERPGPRCASSTPKL